MSIVEEDSNAVIKLGTVHSWIFKISLFLMPVFSVWMVTTVLSHDRDIAVLQMQMTMMERGSKGSVSQNVNVGKAEAPLEELATARDYVTTADIAKNFRILPNDSECCGEIPNLEPQTPTP